MKPLTAPEIVKELDRHIASQEQAKRTLAVALRNRWRRQRAEACLPDDPFVHHFLIAGPRGAGKSEIVRRAAQAIDAPFLQLHALQLTDETSVDAPIRAIIDTLLDGTSHDDPRAEVERAGVILIEGIDHWPVDDDDEDGYGRFRQAVLRFATTPVLETRRGHISTRDLMMFATGSVVTGRSTDIPPDLQYAFPGRIELDPLCEGDLLRILTNPETSPATSYAALLATEGLQVTFSPAALGVIASKCAELNRGVEDIGARRLTDVIEMVLDDLLFDPASALTTHLVIDESYVSSRLDGGPEDDDLDDFIL